MEAAPELRPTENPRSEASRRLELMAGNAAKEIVHHPYVERLGSAEVHPDEWHTFLVERYQMAQGFVPLLKAGLASAREAELSSLRHAFLTNALEETGGVIEPELASSDEIAAANESNGAYVEESHEVWRQRFLAGLGVSESASDPSEATKQYSTVLEEIAQRKDPYEIAGALLLLELSIPGEFRRIITGLEKAFPEFREADSEAPDDIRTQREGVRKYLVDHAQHDTRHYEEIRDAIARSVVDQAGVSEQITASVQRGIEALKHAKVVFYNQFAARG